MSGGGPVTEGLVREIHKRLVEGVRGGSAAPGEYRRIQNYVVNAATREVVYTLRQRTTCRSSCGSWWIWLNRERDIHPVLVRGIVQFQLVHIHPFLDGNGRASRLLSTVCWYRAGYDCRGPFTISEYYDRDRAAFYWAIQRVRERDMDLTGWLEFFTAGLAAQLDEVKGRGERTIRRDALVREHALSAGQAAALGQVSEHGRVTIHDYKKLCPERTGGRRSGT